MLQAELRWESAGPASFFTDVVHEHPTSLTSNLDLKCWMCGWGRGGRL